MQASFKQIQAPRRCKYNVLGSIPPLGTGSAEYSRTNKYPSAAVAVTPLGEKGREKERNVCLSKWPNLEMEEVE